MTYGEFKTFVMQLIDQYSARGVTLTGEYNDQADFFARIPGIYNAVMLELASGPSPLVAVMEPQAADVTERQGFMIVSTPQDFLKMSEDGLPVGERGRMTRVKDYWMLGTDRVMIRKELFRDAVLEYWRTPTRLEAAPADSVGLDGTVEMQTAAAYYVAALLVIREDPFLYAALRNEYDDRVQSMKKRRRAENFFVTDPYLVDAGPW